MKFPLDIEYSKKEALSDLALRLSQEFLTSMIYLNSQRDSSYSLFLYRWASLVIHMVKNTPTACRRPGSIPRSGEDPLRRVWQPTQHSCLEKSIDRE